ncbi:hypothetical protein [Ruminococcus flavefaciens]|uniref:hypothetical protein n=1 Tax=Ruminococcus flavefaciens TaxID=1265 RepID=UPI0002E32FAD|nr:hypothetical protein [Ruminococcus flavefaciens]
MSDWWNKENNIPFEDSNFRKIECFYLYNCPVIMKNSDRVAQRGIDFISKGWDTNSLRRLVDEMKKNNSNPIFYHSCKPNEKVDEIMKQSEMDNNNDFEAVILFPHSELSMAQTIFYYIRNGFAHGSFSVTGRGENRMYFFESKKSKKIKGQIRIKETTLLYWIDLFNEPEKCKKKKNLKRVVAKNDKRKKAA